jgi:hypothetical protein
VLALLRRQHKREAAMPKPKRAPRRKVAPA